MRDKGERERELWFLGSKYVVGRCEAVYMEGTRKLIREL